MAPRPATTPFQEDVYRQLGAWRDADYGSWHLLEFIGAIASMFDQIETYARDDNGLPGWSLLLDPDRCPVEALPFLAQFVGVRSVEGLTEQQKRDKIKATDGFKRGTPGSIIGAAQLHLTGNKTVIMKERDGGAYDLTVITHLSETPDAAAVLASIIEQKPAGIVLTYQVVDGTTYLLVRATYATYTDLRNAFATYDGLRNNIPGT